MHALLPLCSVRGHDRIKQACHARCGQRSGHSSVCTTYTFAGRPPSCAPDGPGGTPGLHRATGWRARPPAAGASGVQVRNGGLRDLGPAEGSARLNRHRPSTRHRWVRCCSPSQCTAAAPGRHGARTPLTSKRYLWGDTQWDCCGSAFKVRCKRSVDGLALQALCAPRHPAPPFPCPLASAHHLAPLAGGGAAAAGCGRQARHPLCQRLAAGAPPATTSCCVRCAPWSPPAARQHGAPWGSPLTLAMPAPWLSLACLSPPPLPFARAPSAPLCTRAAVPRAS